MEPCPDFYDKAALSIFKEWGIDPDGPVEDDCINPLYRFSSPEAPSGALCVIIIIITIISHQATF